MTTQDQEDLELNAKAAGGSLKEEIRQLLKDFLDEKTKCENLQGELNDAKTEIEVILKNQLLATSQRDRAIDIANGIMDWDKPGDARQSMKDLSALKKEIRG
jgi:esterase/lipase